MVPWPVRRAMIAAREDEDHAAEQRVRYAARREALRPSLEAARFTVDHSEAGLYLWAIRDEDCWTSVEWLADQGILTAPGEFYGPKGQQHVRVGLTGTDEAVADAAKRLS